MKLYSRRHFLSKKNHILPVTYFRFIVQIPPYLNSHGDQRGEHIRDCANRSCHDHRSFRFHLFAADRVHPSIPSSEQHLHTQRVFDNHSLRCHVWGHFH